MATIALSVIGTGNYQETTYQWESQLCRTNLFPIAVQQFFQPDKMFFLMTQEAQDKYGAVLEHALATKTDIQILRIPTGRNPEELWEIFHQVTKPLIDEQQLPKDRIDHLIIDITHGYRSLPIILLGSIIYLQIVLEIQHHYPQTIRILYGAFEAQDKEQQRTPVFDLTGFIEMIRWSWALRTALQTYRFDTLASILEEIQNTYHRMDYPNPPQALKPFGAKLKTFGLASQFGLPLLGMDQGLRIYDQIPQVQEELNRLPQGKPLHLLLNDLAQKFQPIAFADTKQDESQLLRKSLNQHLQFIKMLIDAGLFIQAILVIREFIITGAGIVLKKSNLWHRNDRKSIEDILNCNRSSRKPISTSRSTQGEDQLQQWRQLWQRVIGIRNRFAHADMGQTPDHRRITAIIKEKEAIQQEIFPKLELLVQQLQDEIGKNH